jgi:undecaprenyl-diphosphatase
MNYLKAILLGIVEGVTEYLPISSTFHLILVSNILQIPHTQFQKSFEIVIQSGAILAIATIYAKTILKDYKIIKLVSVAFLPTAIVGFVLYSLIKDTFFDEYSLQTLIFAIVGVLFILYEKSKKATKTTGIDKMTLKQAFIIGVLQSLAVFPGVSRAGAVMLAAMSLGFNREESARFSFLLAIPTLVGASVLDTIKSYDTLISLPSSQITALALGFVFSFLSAFVVVKWFIKYLQRHTLLPLGYYRIALAMFVWIYFSNRGVF